MADIGVGEAIALGNVAQVDRSKPFTNAVLNKQKFDLAKEEKKAKERDRVAQEQKTLAGMLNFGQKGFSPFYAEEGSKIIAEGTQKQLDAHRSNDYIGLLQAKDNMLQQLDSLKMQDDELKNFKGLKKQGFIIPPELENAISQPRSVGHPQLQKLLAEKPEYNSIVNYDKETGNYSFNPVKDINLGNSYDNIINKNADQMTETKFIRKLVDGSSLYEMSLSPLQLTHIASAMATDPDILSNAKFKHPAEFKKYYQEAKEELPELPENQLEATAGAKLFKQELNTRNRKPHFVYPNNNNNNPQPIPSPVYGNATAIIIQHPNVAGVEKDYPATSEYHAQVELTNGAFPTSMIRDAKSGKKVSSKDPLTILKSGDVEVYPIYKEGTKSTDGKIDLSGRIVPNEVINKTNGNSYEYKPILLGITQDDDQVLVPFDSNNDVMNTLKKGSKDRRAQTEYDVNQAYKVAEKKNRDRLAAHGNKNANNTGSSKVLKGTLAQLTASAKAKGLSVDAYKQQLTKQGYKAIVQ